MASLPMTTRQWGLIAAAAVALAAVPVGAIALGALFVPPGGFADPGQSAQTLGRDLAGRNWHQVRIEQHVIIRITPGDPALLRDLPLPEPQPAPEHMRERRIPPCMPVTMIAGVRPLASNRLLLFLRNRRLIAADLSRNCPARDFYLGFYISPTSDGQLCVGRDTIHSRAGTSCTISQVRELIPKD